MQRSINKIKLISSLPSLFSLLPPGVVKVSNLCIFFHMFLPKHDLFIFYHTGVCFVLLIPKFLECWNLKRGKLFQQRQHIHHQKNYSNFQYKSYIGKCIVQWVRSIQALGPVFLCLYPGSATYQLCNLDFCLPLCTMGIIIISTLRSCCDDSVSKHV